MQVLQFCADQINDMYKTISSSAIIIVILLFFVAATRQDKPLNKARWLVGDWVSKSGVHENWAVQNDSLFAGKSFFINGKDTMVMETIQLLQRGNELFYIPTVKNQNGGQPVSFKMIKLTDKEMEFENLGHDFPQKISYTQVGKDSLLAEISGMVNGVERSRLFPMTRSK